MLTDRSAKSLTLLMAISLLAAQTVFAQGVTGTISGVVQDAQGGVLPGATVTITSQTRGTASSPVITNATGNFVIPNVAADTYTIQVEMPQFSTLRRQDVPVSPGDHVALGALVLQLGSATEVITVTGEAPLIQAASSERSFTIATDSVEEPSAGPAWLRRASRARSRRGFHERESPGRASRRRRWREFHGRRCDCRRSGT